MSMLIASTAYCIHSPLLAYIRLPLLLVMGSRSVFISPPPELNRSTACIIVGPPHAETVIMVAVEPSFTGIGLYELLFDIECISPIKAYWAFPFIGKAMQNAQNARTDNIFFIVDPLLYYHSDIGFYVENYACKNTKTDFLSVNYAVSFLSLKCDKIVTQPLAGGVIRIPQKNSVQAVVKCGRAVVCRCCNCRKCGNRRGGGGSAVGRTTSPYAPAHAALLG